MRSLGVFICVLAMILSACAAELIGTVKDFADGTLLSGCEVTIASLHLQAITNQSGQFVLHDLPVGRFVVSVSRNGYHVYRVEQTVSDTAATYRFIVELKATESGETTEGYQKEQPRYSVPEVTVTTSRASAHSPVTFTNVARDEISERSFGQDMPILFTELPNVTAYSDGGNGIGYSYLRMRGFGQNRVAVQINGTPLNDAGDGEVFWIDLPDLAEDLQDMQVQRGVGSAFYGPAAFGGSINLVTPTPGLNDRPRLRAEGMYGTWNTWRSMVQFQSGRIQNRYGITARFTRLATDGYRFGSWTRLWSYYLSAARFSAAHTTRLVFYGGPEKTHLSYDGATRDQLAADRRYNPLSYPGEIDNFFQPHYELHDEWKLSPVLQFNNSFYLFRGDGYYDQWRENQSVHTYYFNPALPDTQINVLRRRNVGETDGGWIPRLSWTHRYGETTIGSEMRLHSAHHEGTILWANIPPAGTDPNYHYYDYGIRKRSFSAYLHNLLNATERMKVLADMQVQSNRYEMAEDKLWGVIWNKTYSSVNPRLGVNYQILQPELDQTKTAAAVYANLSLAQREPTYHDVYDPQDYYSLPISAPNHFQTQPGGYEYIGPTLKPEKLLDLEVGTQWQWRMARIGLNYYFMTIRDELVPYGTLDDLGVPVTGNAERTRHSGVEIVAAISPTHWLNASGNLALTNHRFIRYQEFDWNTGVLVSRNGNRLANDPPYVGNLRVEIKPNNYLGVNPWGAISFQAVGRQFIDNTQDGKTTVPAYALMNLDIGLRLTTVPQDLKAVELRLRVSNLFDKKYEAFGFISDPGPVYMVGAPRAYYLTMAVEL
jgi:iron complex outermembrane recepter protein